MLHVLSAKMHDIRTMRMRVKKRKRENKNGLWIKMKGDEVVELVRPIVMKNKDRDWTNEQDQTHEIKLTV